MRLVLASRLAEVRRTVDLAAEFCATHSLAERDANAIGVALDEVLSNIIHHGFGDSGAREITVTLNYACPEISVEIEDDGPPFDPTEAPEPRFAPSVAERRLGGLGLVFVRALTDSITYRRVSERNHLTLRRRISDNAPSAHASPDYGLNDRAHGAGRLIVLEGRLDSEAARTLRDRLLALIIGGSSLLAVDLTRVPYIGSAGIWALLAADDLAASRGGGLVVFGLRPEIVSLFERTGIAGTLRACNTPEEALLTLRPTG